MAWRRKQDDKGLTHRGKRLYEQGMKLLAGEVAAVEEIDLSDARTQIWKQLRENLPPA
jgi:RNA polymerase-interacting CarD/CdnL/TRCF family regulator